MRKRLQPINGVLLAGLIGAAYATCYYELTSVCASTTDELTGGGIWVGNNFHQIYPKVNWYKHNVYTTGSGGNTGLNPNQSECSGPAKLHNGRDGRDYDVGEMGTGEFYDTVNYGSPSC